MAWTIEYDVTAVKGLRHIGKREARRIVDYIEERIAGQDNPRALGSLLRDLLELFGAIGSEITA
ncbi:type II toxin-antitoxin system RelE family toxin [Dethiosulfovibrio salsuginis]|uniref:mRNA interferase RelE/StbE n=1 Tax=Dethiosulfovibrio salsuginis TaxID=561720 RepID=A0A1X7JKT4_9BACT|nr:hypothetical protein [Dethiosulfovibrio salsuginis]SMG28772.1 mRNA interferase RelE/StbE [Dethiosulfovibrio salsuginis]